MTFTRTGGSIYTQAYYRTARGWCETSDTSRAPSIKTVREATAAKTALRETQAKSGFILSLHIPGTDEREPSFKWEWDGFFSIKNHLGPETRKAITGLQRWYSASHCKLMRGWKKDELMEDDLRMKVACDERGQNNKKLRLHLYWLDV